MDSRTGRLLTLLSLFAGGWAGAAGAGIIQITDPPNISSVSAPSINADARYVTFSSDSDFGGLNPTSIENVFLYQVPTDHLTRVTNQGGSTPTINADGRWIAFSSSGNYVRRNADGSDEIFRYDRSWQRFYQATGDQLGDGASALPVINASGKEVVYETTSNIHRGNPDLSNEVYLLKRNVNHALSIDPVGDGESHSPTVSSDGKFVAFQSTSNLTGHNEDLSQELMLYNVARHRLVQVTNDPDGTGQSGSPTLSGDGRFLAFISSSNVAGLNPDGANAVFLMNRPRQVFSVITQTGGGLFDADMPTITDDGRWIAFVTGFDVTRGNPDGNSEIIVYDRTRKTFTQVTDSSACDNYAPKFSADGTRIAFLSDCDYTGGNAGSDQQIFLADNPLSNLVFHSAGPVSLYVEDPAGLIIGPSANFIPRASYARGDFDGDGQQEVRVTIPQALEGQYQITIVPDAGAVPTDPASVDVSLNGVTASLASDTVSAVSAQMLSFGNQGFLQRWARIVPMNGIGSSQRLLARLGHGLAATGAVTVRFTDGVSEALFDLGRIEAFSGASWRKTFRGVVNGFTTTARITKQTGGRTIGIRFAARNGDLSAFEGTDDLSMVLVVQIGPDTSMYSWRFKRRASGTLLLAGSP